MTTTCASGIFQDIVADCTTASRSGFEEVAYIGNRKDIGTFTVTDGVVTDLSMKANTYLHKYKGTSKNMNAGHDGSMDDIVGNVFSHYLQIHNFELGAKAIQNIDNLQDVFVIVERKQKNALNDGVFLIYGFDVGLYKNSDTRRENENHGSRIIELQTRDGEYESKSCEILNKTDYETTVSLLEGLLKS